MGQHRRYLAYLLRHKWYVAVECFKRGLYWRGIVHDLSKFRPSEWKPYAEYFYGTLRSTEFWDLQEKYGVAELAPWGESVEDWFNFAWLQHQHRNPHHWQHWILRMDDGGTIAIPMPNRYRVEMLCDWIGAGKAQGHTAPGECLNWFTKNRSRIKLHTDTLRWVEAELGYREAAC